MFAKTSHNDALINSLKLWKSISEFLTKTIIYSSGDTIIDIENKRK